MNNQKQMYIPSEKKNKIVHPWNRFYKIILPDKCDKTKRPLK